MTTSSPRSSAAVVRGRFARLATEERGAVAVLAALLIVVLMAAVAFTIDLGRLYHERQALQNAVDFGALAGAHELPANNGAAADIAAQTAIRVTVDNHPGLDPHTVNTTFQCVVGDRDGDGQPDEVDVGAICGRRGDTAWATGWTVKHGKAWHACNPYGGDLCNTIVVSTRRSIPYFFAPVIGIDTGSTGVVSGASCRGACGAAGSPLDVVMVIDRTGSMSTQDLSDAKDAARSVLQLYNPDTQHVGLVTLPYGGCAPTSNQTYPNTSNVWQQETSLSSNYQNADGSLNQNSEIVRDINCITKRSGGSTTPSPKNLNNATQCTLANGRALPASNNLCSGETDLGDPLVAAASLLASAGRADVPHVILFMTDGEANQPFTQPGNSGAQSGAQPCAYALSKASIVKGQAVTLYTIGFGIEYQAHGNNHPDGVCYNDWSGSYSSGPSGHGQYASTLLANMASEGPDGTPTTDDRPGGCNTATENNDGDGYFCLPKSEDLSKIFVKAATQALGSSRLLDL